MSFTVGTHPPSLSFDLGYIWLVTDIVVYGHESINWDTITAYVMKTDSTWTQCGSPMDFTAGVAVTRNSGEANCASGD